jgi:hypothetical protein
MSAKSYQKPSIMRLAYDIQRLWPFISTAVGKRRTGRFSYAMRSFLAYISYNSGLSYRTLAHIRSMIILSSEISQNKHFKLQALICARATDEKKIFYGG